LGEAQVNSVNRCGHEGPSRRVCKHLSADPDADELDYVVFIEGSTDYALICASCREKLPSVEFECLCEDCFAEQEAERYWDDCKEGVTGTFTAIILDNTEFETDFVGAWDGSINGAGYVEGWVLCGPDAFARIGFDGKITKLVQPPEVTAWLHNPRESEPELSVNTSGRFAALVDAHGGIVWDLESGEIFLRPERADYQSKQTKCPIAFVRRGERDFVAHASAWNALELFDLKTRQACTTQPAESDELNYFFGALHVSPGGTSMASTGWVWAPVGLVACWDLLVWEETPITRQQCRFLAQRAYSWDNPCVWLDETRLAIWGFGNDDLNLVDAICIYDTKTGNLQKIVPGVPSGRLTFDGRLLHCTSTSDGVSVWNLESGARVAHHAALSAIHDSGANRVLTFEDGKFTILCLRSEM